MGTDNLHHKRRARTVADLQRKRARKTPYKRILIVCEGEATEINYFSALINDFRLPTVNAVAVPSPSTCPEANVVYGLNEHASGDWDLVFCVFDKDSHAKFDQAVERLSSCDEAIQGGYSVPCFEYWLLLHFIYTNKSFYGHPTKSAGQSAVRELGTYISEYRKGAKNLYALTCAQLEQAKAFALKANQAAIKEPGVGSMTLVVHVIQALQDLREEIDA